MKFIETKREELRRERIALHEQEWPELVQLLKGIGEKFINPYATSTLGCRALRWQDEWIRTDDYTPTITLAELKAKYFEPKTREPKVGDWGYFWDIGSNNRASFGRLDGIEGGRFRGGCMWDHFSHTIPPHIQEAMKEPEYEVVYEWPVASCGYMGPSTIEVKHQTSPDTYFGERRENGEVFAAVLKRVEK